MPQLISLLIGIDITAPQEGNENMKQGDVITLSNGEKATVTVGDESPNFNNIYVVRLKNGDYRVIDRKTLTLASNRP